MTLFSGPHTNDTIKVWDLLNDTVLLLHRTTIENRFADSLSTIRARLQQAPSNQAILKGVYHALVELRKQMRLCGYDFSMGKFTLVFDGFRNDEAIVLGYRRMVLYIGEKNFYWRSGDENHTTLAENLNRRLNHDPHRETITGRHYLWFLWGKTTLTLSGAATEIPEDYGKLKAQGEADSLLFLSKLKDLK
jgi:hypothetical protein